MAKCQMCTLVQEYHRGSSVRVMRRAVLKSDQHFTKGKKIFEDPQFVTPLKRPITKADRAFNASLYDIRSRVEHPFGWFDKKFQSLAKPWGERACPKWTSSFRSLQGYSTFSTARRITRTELPR